MTNHVVSMDLLKRDYGYRRLQDAHRRIESRLELMQAVPGVDPVQLTAMKREKLLLRDRMRMLERRHMH